MLKKLLPLLVVLALIIGGVVWATSNNNDNDSTSTNPPAPTPQTQTETTTPPPSSDNTTTQNANQVSIANMAFSPTTLTVKKGTTVTWTNNDSVTHTVTADAPSEHAPDSGDIAPGDKYTFTFDDEGTFAYHCEPHPQMQATVVVTDN